MSEDWKAGYRRALLGAFARSAYALRTDERNSYYGGPFDYGTTGLIHEHLWECAVDTDASPLPEDVSWEQFQGTFAEDHTVHGLEGRLTCRCGHLRGVRVRWQGTFSELLEAILREN